MAKSVLVMGGSYFIGKRIVEELLKEGYEVTVLNRGSRLVDGTTQIVCDRNHPQLLKKALENMTFDYVVDVSGTNAQQMKYLCNAIQMDEIQKLLFISSSAVYDIPNLPIPFQENDYMAENRYWREYGRDKIEAELFLRNTFKQTEKELFILRPPYVYGEGNYAQRESFIFDHLWKRKPILLPKSNPKLQFIYAGDLAKVVCTLLGDQIYERKGLVRKERKKENISIFNVGNRKPVTAKQWIKACEKVSGKTARIVPYEYWRDNRNVRDFFPFQDYDNVLDVKKMKSIYNLETKFEDGLKESYKWYLKEKESISFKENVTANEKEILTQMWNREHPKQKKRL